MFWILNKETDTPYNCGSVPAVVKLTGIKESRLTENFSRKKKTSYTTEVWRVEKTDMLTSTRNGN